jgi:hypothetical protein
MDNFCKANPRQIKVNPDNCAQYFNCSDTTSQLGHFKEECKYPDLFSTTTMTCQPFNMVPCQTRMEPKAPCKSTFIWCYKLELKNILFVFNFNSAVAKKESIHRCRFETRQWRLVVLRKCRSVTKIMYRRAPHVFSTSKAKKSPYDLY